MPGAARVHGEPGRLGAVFLSLLVNAQQALPGEEPRRFGSSATAIGRSQRHGHGRRIDPSIRKHLFEPFTTTKAGTGLGLAASFKIARAHGGDLSFAVGTGATFVLKLPLAGDGVTKVLVIDDEQFVRKVITAMLAGSG